MPSSVFRFSFGLVGFAAIFIALLVVPTTLRVTGHEGDLLHMVDGVLRMVEGDRPHLDFMTPLGVLAFWPMAAAVEAGFGPGRAFLVAQAVALVAALPLIWWVAVSRFEGRVRAGFALYLVVLMASLVYGGAEPAASVSMFYNRWGWMLVFLISALLLLPARVGWRMPVLDGAIIGLALGVLVFLKVTFAVALMPALLLAALHDRDWPRILAAFLAGLAVSLAVALGFGGPGFLVAYLGDLRAVAGGEIRQKPGLDLMALLSNPERLPSTLALLAGVVVWRKAAAPRAGLLLLALGPGWIYITFQNWGNDPKFLVLFALLLLALPLRQPEARVLGVGAAQAVRTLAIFAIAVQLPSIGNLAYAPARHLFLEAERFSPLLPNDRAPGIEIETARNFTGSFRTAMPPVGGPAGWEAPISEPTRLNGAALPRCQLITGLVGWTHQAVADLNQIAEARGARVQIAGLSDHLWLFGAYERTRSAPIWYYTETGSTGEAQYLLVPLCPIAQEARAGKLAHLAALGAVLTEIQRTPLAVLLRVERDAE